MQNRYRIVRQLGSGGMGAVYEAIDERFGQPIALKEIIAEVESSYQQSLISKAFEREAKSLAIARHEVVPFVRDYFTEEGSQFLVMELVEGDDLAEMLKAQKSPFPIPALLNWMEQLLDALDYLHTLSPPIIHRDIKPQNLKVNSRNKVKLLDFGIARSSDKNSTMTAHTFVGATLNYSPIEQMLRVLDENFRDYILQKHQEKAERILKQDTDPRVDIYALGGTFYHLMTNRPPIDAVKRLLAIWDGKGDPLEDPMSLNPNIPPILSYCILKAMEVDRKNRYGSAKEMADDFKRAQSAFNQAQYASPKSTDLSSLITQVDTYPRSKKESEISQPPTVEPYLAKQNPVNQPSTTQQSPEQSAQPVQPITQPSNLQSNTSPVNLTAPEIEKNHPQTANSYIKNDNQSSANKTLWKAGFPEVTQTSWISQKLFIGGAGILLTLIFSAGSFFIYSKFTQNGVESEGLTTSPAKLADQPIVLPANEPVYLNPGLENNLITQAKDCYEKKSYQCTIDNLSNLIKSTSNNAVAFNNRGVAYFLKGNYNQAVNDYSQAIKINPQNPVFYHNRSLGYQRLNNQKAAQTDADKAASLNK